MKILLTGSAGFTGIPFTKMALAAGHTVLPLKANLLDIDELRAEVLLLAPDAVVHLAGISFVGHSDDSAFYAVNVVGTTNLLLALACLPSPPSCVLLASSANIYGNCDASPITETQPPAPTNHYATSKVAMEYMARTFADRLPVVVARPFNYTGPGQVVDFLIPKLVDHFVRRAPTIELGNLHVEREYNDVEMICQSYLQLLKYSKPNTYNVCSGKPYTLQNVLDLLTRITSHQIKVIVNPAFVRVNEVHRLCGSPAKLQDLLSAHGASRLEHPTLEYTLRRMLAATAH